MSIIMAGSGYTAKQPAQCAKPFAPAIRDLLDHVAAELAAEYVRLMEAAAEAETPCQHGPQKVD